MKKIIDQTMYNTDTATEIGEWEDIANLGNAHYYTETLYQKKNGEFFIYGEGQPFSPYGQVVQGGHTDSSDIVALDPSEARQWAEEKLDPDKYEEIFGEVSENGNVKEVTTQLSKDEWTKLNQLAEDNGISLSELVNSAIKRVYFN